MAQDGRRVNSYNYQSNVSTEYQRFRNEYFTGADIRIYFGDIWIDEITSLQFTLQEQVAPIFGYASYTWDKVARGNRHVQGTFAINFKESFYLHSVMERLNSKLNGASSGTPIFDTNQWKEGVEIEQLVASSAGTQFDSIADEFEKSLWGEGANDSINRETAARSKNTYFSPEHRGKNADDGTPTYDETISRKQLAESGFNIIIAYGPMNEIGGMSASETVHSLIGVQLTGVSTIIGGDGSPIQEQYSFIAKDLDGNVQVRG